MLAGILERQADELTRAYAPWLRLERWPTSDDGWILMTRTWRGRRRQRAWHDFRMSVTRPPSRPTQA